MRLRRRCGRRYKKMMTNMGLAGCSLPRSLFRPQREGGRDERGREGRGREGGTEGANGLSEKQTTTPPPPPNGPQNEASEGMEDVDDRARIPARAVTAIPRHPISPSPPFLSSPSNQEGDGPRSLSPSPVSLSEEECKNSLEALSKLSRTPTAHPAAAALPLSLGPPGLVCLDRVELTSDAPRLLLPQAASAASAAANKCQAANIPIDRSTRRVNHRSAVAVAIVGSGGRSVSWN